MTGEQNVKHWMGAKKAICDCSQYYLAITRSGEHVKEKN